MVDEYFTVAYFTARPRVRDIKPNVLYESKIWLHSEQTKLTRQVYNIFDLLGDLGGVTEVIMIFFGFILYSISEHSFYLTASKKLFFARTNENNIFATSDESLKRKKKYLSTKNYPKDSTKKEILEF